MVSEPFASRFFSESFFSLCSRGVGTGAFFALAALLSGLSGEDAAGVKETSSSADVGGGFKGDESGGSVWREWSGSAMVIAAAGEVRLWTKLPYC